MITALQFKCKVFQLLTFHGCARPGKRYSYLENLFRGMLKRLQKQEVWPLWQVVDGIEPKEARKSILHALMMQPGVVGGWVGG